METKDNNPNKPAAKTPRNSRRILIVAMALSLFCVTILIFHKHSPNAAAPKPYLVQAPASSHASQEQEEQAPTPPFSKTAQPLASEAQTAANEAAETAKPQEAAQPKKDSKPKAEKVVQDPLSRVALGLVGVDPVAEDYWMGAVFDPGLPKSERQDLVDDLNEQGLPDPKHPTEDDLPVLFSRLEMLEGLIPILDGNLEWEEPLDDLLNLIDLAMGGGRPVH
jgi:hypothetical protein